MAYSVKTGSQALIQLDISLDYIRETLGSPQAAHKLLEAFTVPRILSRSFLGIIRFTTS